MASPEEESNSEMIMKEISKLLSDVEPSHEFLSHYNS